MLLARLLALNLLDLVLSCWLISALGRDNNPLAQGVYELWGMAGIVAFKIAFIVPAAFIFWRASKDRIVWHERWMMFCCHLTEGAILLEMISIAVLLALT